MHTQQLFIQVCTQIAGEIFCHTTDCHTVTQDNLSWYKVVYCLLTETWSNFRRITWITVWILDSVFWGTTYVWVNWMHFLNLCVFWVIFWGILDSEGKIPQEITGINTAWIISQNSDCMHAECRCNIIMLKQPTNAFLWHHGIVFHWISDQV